MGWFVVEVELNPQSRAGDGEGETFHVGWGFRGRSCAKGQERGSVRGVGVEKMRSRISQVDGVIRG